MCSSDLFKDDLFASVVLIDLMYVVPREVYGNKPEYFKYFLAHIVEWLNEEDSLEFIFNKDKQIAYKNKKETDYDVYLKSTQPIVSSGFKVPEKTILTDEDKHRMWMTAFALKEIFKFSPQPPEPAQKTPNAKENSAIEQPKMPDYSTKPKPKVPPKPDLSDIT